MNSDLTLTGLLFFSFFLLIFKYILNYLIRFRSHENVGPPAPQQEYTRDSREREFQRERPDEREERPGGDYDGPAGMQPEGIIEVCLKS